MQPRDVVERLRLRGQSVGLRILDHLQPVLDGAQEAIVARERLGRIASEPTGADEGCDRIQRCGRPDRRVAAAVDHLLDLDEELDLADSAAPAFKIETWTDFGALREMVANPRRDLP